MAFKSSKKENNHINENKVDEFISAASGETGDKKNTNIKKVIVAMDESLHARLKHYRNTEAKKIETMNLIANLAIDSWLKEKGF